MSEQAPLKILCLHGRFCNKQIMKIQMSSYMKYFGKRAKFDFIDAPFAVPKDKNPEIISKHFGDVQTFEKHMYYLTHNLFKFH